jgi:hypothetical protein
MFGFFERTFHFQRQRKPRTQNNPIQKSFNHPLKIVFKGKDKKKEVGKNVSKLFVFLLFFLTLFDLIDSKSKKACSAEI